MEQESNFRITASGPVGFDCWEGGGFPNCDPMIFKIFGTAPATGTFIGSEATFETVEKATPQPPDLHPERDRRARRRHSEERRQAPHPLHRAIAGSGGG